jgi:hypothetical protein
MCSLGLYGVLYGVLYGDIRNVFSDTLLRAFAQAAMAGDAHFYVSLNTKLNKQKASTL